jgi:CHASE2 domain-containing sensor protein
MSTHVSPVRTIARDARASDDCGMRLLVAFVAATLTMVGAVVLLLRGNSDWVDFVALALLLAVAVAVLTVIAREVREEEPPNER